MQNDPMVNHLVARIEKMLLRKKSGRLRQGRILRLLQEPHDANHLFGKTEVGRSILAGLKSRNGVPPNDEASSGKSG